MCLIIDIVANHVRQMTVRPDYSEGKAVGSRDPFIYSCIRNTVYYNMIIFT